MQEKLKAYVQVSGIWGFDLHMTKIKIEKGKMALDVDIMTNANEENDPASAHLEFCFMNRKKIGIWFYGNNVFLFLCYFLFIQWPLAHLQ